MWYCPTWIRTEFDTLGEIIKNIVDLRAVVEIKIDASFPSAQSFIEWYRIPYRRDISHKSGTLLKCAEATIPLRQPSLSKFWFRIQSFGIQFCYNAWLVHTIILF